MAADPKVFPYGAVLNIKGVGKRLGVDYPVIDLFFENKSDAIQFANSQPVFTTVRVVKLGLD